MLRHWGTTSHRREGLLLARRRGCSDMSQWRSWSMGQGGYVCAVLLAPNLCFVDLPAEANPTRILPYHVHAPPHPPPCRALWITRARFHRRQMRQSWASTMVFAASRPLPNGNTWDESQQEHGPGNVRSFVALVGCTQTTGSVHLRPTLLSNHQPPTTSTKCPYPTSKRPLLASGPLGGFSASSMIEVYPN